MYDYAIEIVNSKRDKSGNVYYFFNATNLKNDKTISANGYCPNFIDKYARKAGIKIYWTRKELSIREFNKLYPKEYAGNNHEEMMRFIQNKTF